MAYIFDLFKASLGLSLHISKGGLPQKGRLQKRKYDKIRRSHKNLLGTSISDRPAEIENRDDFGHWEFDTVVGKKSTKSVLLVMSERKTRFELIFKLKSKT